MKKLLSSEMAQEIFDRIKKANKSVIGTHDYLKYQMQIDFKSCSGAWKFCGCGIPVYVATKVRVSIKTWKDRTYLIVESIGDAERYTLTDEVKKLIEDLIKFED